jgi:integrase
MVDLRTAGGERYRRTFRSKKEALAHERCVLLAIAAGTFGVEVKQVPTVRSFAADFIAWSEQYNKPSTVAAKRIALDVHLLPALGELRLDASELRAEVARFVTAKLKAGLSAKTVRNTLAVVGKLLSLAAERGVIQSVPKLGAPRVTKPEPAFLTFEEAERLLDAAEPAWRTWLLVLLRTGLRVGEALALHREDVDLKGERPRITVRRSMWNGTEGSPKNGKLRVVPLTRETVTALRAQQHLRGPYVFCHEDGRPFTHSEVKDVVPNACRRAGLAKRLTTHGLRHTYASHLVMRRTPVTTVRELLGHADLTMVARYTHLSPDIAHAAVQVLDAPANQGN